MSQHEGKIHTETNSSFGWYVELDGKKIYYCEHFFKAIKATAMLGLQKIFATLERKKNQSPR